MPVIDLQRMHNLPDDSPSRSPVDVERQLRALGQGRSVGSFLDFRGESVSYDRRADGFRGAGYDRGASCSKFVGCDGTPVGGVSHGGLAKSKNSCISIW